MTHSSVYRKFFSPFATEVVAYESFNHILRKLSQILIFFAVTRPIPAMFSRQLDSFALVNLDYLWSCLLTDVLCFLVYTFYFNILEVSISRENMALEVLNEVFERDLP